MGQVGAVGRGVGVAMGGSGSAPHVSPAALRQIASHRSLVALRRSDVSGATVSILDPSIDHLTALAIAGQHNADAESMIRAALHVRTSERSGGTWRQATRAGDPGKGDERGARRRRALTLPLLALPLLPLPLPTTPTQTQACFLVLIPPSRTQLSPLLTSPTRLMCRTSTDENSP